MLVYTRYLQAEEIYKKIFLDIDIKTFQVLDFGALVSDYGIYFARQGAQVTTYDYPKYTDFLKLRFGYEGLRVTTKEVPTDYSSLFKGKDLVIFSEVLEHVDNPLEILQVCVDKKVKYIFTSCFPYGNDVYYNYNGHKKTAQLQQSACKDLLVYNYTSIPTLRESEVLWKRK